MDRVVLVSGSRDVLAVAPLRRAPGSALNMLSYDALIVGSGPAGVAAAFPLLEAGLKVAMVAPEKSERIPAPHSPYKAMRMQDQSQWKQTLGEDFYALRKSDGAAVSPKLRIPRLAFAFEGYADAYRLATDGATVNGSLASGGLSNAWGAGVACFDDADLESYPICAQDLAPSYQKLAKRVGLSGVLDDDLSDFFGKGIAIDPPTSVDPKLAKILDRYHDAPQTIRKLGVRLGRSRHAVLTRSRGTRGACKDCGQCLAGCAENAIYNSAYDLDSLLDFPNFQLLPGILIETIDVIDGRSTATGRRLLDNEPLTFQARSIMLGCGAIGTAAIVLRSLQIKTPVRLLSNPVAAFALWLPTALGSAVPDRFFSLGELDFVVEWAPGAKGYAFGAVFSTHGLPATEFITRFPVSLRGSVDLCRRLLPSIVVGNCFMPAEFSAHTLRISDNGALNIKGGFSAGLQERLTSVRKTLTRAFRTQGAYMMPGTFTLGEPCADLHYAGTVPMRARPARGECNASGQIEGLPNVYAIDGAALTTLPAKSHTFTIMANADRIATIVARQLAFSTSEA